MAYTMPLRVPRGISGSRRLQLCRGIAFQIAAAMQRIRNSDSPKNMYMSDR